MKERIIGECRDNKHNADASVDKSKTKKTKNKGMRMVAGSRYSFLKNKNRIINAIIKYIIPLPINPSINCNVDNPIQAKQRNNLMYL